MSTPGIESYEVKDSHPFYAEMLQFFIAAISMTMAMRQDKVEEAIQKVIAEARKMATSFNLGMPYNSLFIIDVPPLDQDVTFADLSCPDACILKNVSHVVAYIRNQTGNHPAPLAFSLQPLPGHSLPPPETTVFGAMITPWISDLSCYLVGGAYERVRDTFERKYGANKQTWAPELQFFRHLRNGCFHGNTFNIEKIRRKKKLVDQIDPTNPPQWRGYKMPSDNAMNGKKVMDGFFFLPHLLPFLHDMGKYV
ncbi:MAG TPA: hypothetical protein VI750_02350 [Pyrinomonadaceae bacterium]|nr:hypothetical protein [Pyrinomonadaceae bacterium]